MKFSRRLAVLCFSFILALSSVGLIISTTNTYATTVEMVTTDLDTSSLSYGTKYTFPATIKQEYKGELRDFTNGTIVFPSGLTYVAGKEVTLSEVGMYTIRYYYQDGTIPITSLKQFIVNDCYYEMPSEVNTYSLSTENINETETYREYIKPDKYKEYDGLSVTLQEGSTFVYKKAINLNETIDETGYSKVIHFNPLGLNRTINEKGDAIVINSVRVEHTVVRITDAYDPDSYIEYEYYMGNSAGYEGYMYVKSGANGQVTGAMVSGSANQSVASGNILFKRGEKWWYVRMSALGTGQGAGNRQLPNEYDGYQLYFDLKNNATYSRTSGSSKVTLINEHSAYEIYPNNMFPGFTTGEVFVSVYAKTFYDSTAKVDIFGIGNDTGAQIKEAYDQYSMVDDVKPVIKIDAVLTDEFGVYKAVGEKFTIPTAHAYDVNIEGIPEVTDVCVYRNYGTENEFVVPVVDGAIKLDKKDIYTIVYSATDTYGNVGTATLNVIPKSVASGKSITFNYTKLTDTLEGGKLKAGVETVLPSYTISSVNGDEFLKFKQSVIYEDGTEVELVENDGVVTFIPLGTGKYTVKYVYSDNVSYFEESYDIECLPSDVVKNLKEPAMYKYFIAGADYSLDSYRVFTFKGKTPVEEETDMYVKIKTDGEYSAPVRVANLNKFSVPADATYIKFLYRHNNVVIRETEDIPVIKITKGQKGFLVDYFVGDENGFTVEDKTKSQIRFDANVKSGSSKISFINPVSYFDFRLSLIIPFGYDKYQKVKVTLTDYANPNNKHEILYSRDGALTFCSIDGGTRLSLTDQFSTASPKNITYNYISRTLTVGTGVSEVLDFNFDSRLCYIDVEMLEINCLETEKAGIIVSEINNQKFNGALIQDTTAPVSAVIKTTGIYNIGDVVTILRPVMNDVLTPVLTEDIEFTVKCKDGTIPVDYDTGEVLNNPSTIKGEYRILVDKYVEYTVGYGIKTSVPNTKYGKRFTNGSYTFSSENKVKPEIDFVHGYDEETVVEINLGQDIFVEFEVSDDNTPTSDIVVAVYAVKLENFAYFFVFEDFKYTPLERGTYKVYAIAEDSFHNITTRYYTVKVV